MAVTAQSLPNDTFKPQADGLYNIGLNSPKTCLGENYGLPPAFERAKNQPSQDLASMGITTVHGQGEEAKSRYTSEHFHTWSKPPALWKPLRHPCCEEVSEEVDRYFLDNWKFPDNRAEKIFIKAGFSKVTSLYFPLAKNDRLHFACRLLTILFLVDDVLEDMSFADGEAYNARLFPIMRGKVQPDRSVPVQHIMYDLLDAMRTLDKELADGIIEPTFTFMHAQTDRVRHSITNLGSYLEYRERDVGKALLSALMRFSMDIHLSVAELKSMEALESNCSKHISVVNDIFSWDKELRASQTCREEGSALCSAVKILANETNLSVDAAKRVLWSMVREWEGVHDRLVTEMATASELSPGARDYIRGLEYQMSGNELWSMTTPRYHVNP